MGKLSFFKLPFILIVLFFFCQSIIVNLRLVIELISISQDYNDFGEILLKFIPYQLFRLIPDCLLLFGVVSIGLYRVNIHVVTLKNVILLMVIVGIICIIDYLLRMITYILFNEELSNFINVDLWSSSFFLFIIPTSVVYLLNGLFTYYFIKAFGQRFDKAKQSFVLTGNNSSHIHFILFLVFFFFISIGFSSFILDILIPKNYYFISLLYYVLIPLCICMIAVLIVLLVIKNTFNQTFVILQSDRIIKSAIFSNLLILLLTVIFIVVEYKLIYLFDVVYHMNELLFIPLATIVLLIQLILSCLIIRKVTKHYFSRTIKNTILFN